eukprot:11226494-Lingulodinium_polyedra.AAC.1
MGASTRPASDLRCLAHWPPAAHRRMRNAAAATAPRVSNRRHAAANAGKSTPPLNPFPRAHRLARAQQ